jgi:hypothetical protein
MQQSESTVLVGGVSMPPKSPQKVTAFVIDALRIPTPKTRWILQIGTRVSTMIDTIRMGP